ncbi:unnamed protein product [Nippostrongylus brasiliensis]|uniref:Transposase n=1 Tax=Nippostrongylus brasiliensis TaxID=27835 RepID=A0A0N4XS13_NIPBR|nr:unnamed protein product [Nippostrongylus brasiliensis]
MRTSVRFRELFGLSKMQWFLYKMPVCQWLYQ